MPILQAMGGLDTKILKRERKRETERERERQRQRERDQCQTDDIDSSIDNFI